MKSLFLVLQILFMSRFIYFFADIWQILPWQTHTHKDKKKLRRYLIN